ncbi:MAG: hypothetical protein BMS9Abin34_381 [Patescibacteria group bacterium]|nr:MAG: hypothetical protein BMS9Abin34_381 [Patescibacteria group bacterium]
MVKVGKSPCPRPSNFSGGLGPKLVMPKRYRKVKRSKKRPSSSWRRLKRQFKVRKRLRRLGLAFTVVAAVLLVLGAIYMWKFFAEPFVSAGSTFQSGVSWDGETPFNVLWLEVSQVGELAPPTKNLGVLSLNPTQNSFTIVTLPVDYQGFRDLYGLGNLSKEKDGMNAVSAAVMSTLGVPIDGYVLVGSEALRQLADIFPQVNQVSDVMNFSSIPQVPAVWRVARQNFRTDLSIPEIARVLWYISRVRSDKVNQVRVGRDLLDAPSVLDRKISPLFRDEKFSTEHLKIQVLNGSREPGLAAASARIIRNIGGEVIRVDNFTRRDLIKGYLLLESSGSYTARRLSQIFGVSDSRPPRTGAEARANITVILGIQNSFK